jgi:predicted nucleic acid-binding protein
VSVCYLDASAVVKLLTPEAETDALREHLKRYSTRVTSRLAAVEVPRALARRGRESVRAGAATLAEILEGLVIVELDEAIAAAAAGIEPPQLRSLAAIHLASALALGPDLETFVSYDARLANAARATGLTVVAPA